MGNQIVRPSDIQSIDNYYSDLKNYMLFKQSLGSTTFVKTAKVVLIDSTLEKNYYENRNQQQDLVKQQYQQLKELQQLVVVKIFPKYDLSVKLDSYSFRVREIQNVINTRYKNSTNCFPFSEILITDQAAYLFRQYIKYNLYDRLSTRPFLTNVEKKWIAFQLLCAVNDIHSLQIVHGDIKIENVMVNSFLWTSLTDFASYKPVYLSKNHPTADFNYFFDISRRRTCYLAPERLDQPKDYKPRINTDLDTGLTEIAPPDPNDFRPEMDIFSLGCVIAELFTERPLFSFAQLLAYKDNKYDPRAELESEISDKNMLEMIYSMISLKADERKTASQYLQEQNDKKSFPSYFVFLRNCISYFIDVKLTGDDFVIKLKNDLPLLLKNFKLNLNESDKADSVTDDLTTSGQESINEAFLILLSVLLSSIRKIKFAENKLIAVDLMQTFSNFLQDSIKLERIIPYYLHLLTDSSPIVKFHVIFALNSCLSSINKLDVRNFNIFPVLIFDHLEKLSKDESFLVRCAVAKTISSFALTSIRFLDLSFITRNSFFTSNLNQDQQKSEENKTYDKEYEKCQSRVKDIVLALLTGNVQNSQVTNAVREVLISSNITKLCLFFQRQKTSDVLLAHMITVLNEKTDWSVRAAFFDALCPVLSNLGWESIDIFKSLIEQGLRDSEEFVIYRTLLSLSKMAEIGLLEKQQIYYFLKNHVAPLLCHPSLWIRHACINFITTVCRNSKNSILNTADILGTVSSILSKFLFRTDLVWFDRADILFESLKPCIKREILSCISQSGNADTLFHYFYQRRDARNYLPRCFEPDCANAKELFAKLCKLGFMEEDDEKILELKDFIEKTKRSQLSSSVNNTEENFSSSRQEQSFRDKIVKFNSENLMSRSYSESKTLEFASSNSNFSSSQNIADKEPAYNAEWKLMFGMEESKPVRHRNSFKNSSQSDIVSPTTQSRRRAVSFNLSNSSNLVNCNHEVDKYIERAKCLFQDQMNKKKKLQDYCESINKSVCSNLIALNKGVGKWKPKGILILNSNEHTKSVNKITRNCDSEFFATCSSSEQCVKIWSVGNLLESRTGLYKSLITLDSKLDPKFRPISTTFYSKSSLAILNEDFKLYLVDFNRSQTKDCKILPNEKLFRSTVCKLNSPNVRYNKINSYYLNKQAQNISAKCSANSCYCPGNYPIELITIDDTSPSWSIGSLNTNEYFYGTKNSPAKGLLCYSTIAGGFNCIDIRCKAKAFDIKRDLKRGFITTMMTDPWLTWIAMGTSTGNIEIFDFRFMLPLANLEHRSKTSVVKMCNNPVSSRKIVATYQANNELCVWNMDGKLQPELVFWGVQSVPALCQNKMSSYYISGLVGISAGDENGTNGLVCASTDMKFRYLDLVEPNRNSSIISSAFNFQAKNCADNSSHGISTSSILPSNVVYETRQIEGNKVLLELDQQYSSNSNSNATSYSSAAFTYQSRFTHHQDAITDLSICYNPLKNKNQPLLITAARDENGPKNKHLIELNPSYKLNSVDSRSFVSLAWFGLWGKTPEKQSEASLNIASDNIKSSDANVTSQETKVDTGSTVNTDIDLSAGYIPEPPPILDENIVLNALGEPTLSSLGLASSWTPVGWIQSLLEIFHVDLGLPWFQAIALFAVCLRTFLLPINVKAQRNSAKLRKIAPEMGQLNEKLSNAKMTGNNLEVARATHEYVQFMKSNQIGFGSMLVPLIQFPFVVSTFIAIRKMCKLPVESMETGGALWFTDLTIADPYFILPTVATASILAIVYRGVDTGMSSANMTPTTKAIVYGVSAISYPFFLFMPSGVMSYVCTTNFISLALSVILNVNAVKKILKIPILTEMDKLKIKESQKKTKNFISGFKESIQNQRIIAEVKERESLREKQFSQAGTKVPVKTFKTNPKETKKN
uniref:non-specific serine/threonine protein kinase n=1 Tax=Brachionus koreanus TaxID=1199090 RepID=A0A2Z4EUM1_9BILA|nr:phosphoinositide 3-kinase regulatory subunit 4 [Brachionus koreanus]